jgi:hypothetical protein
MLAAVTVGLYIIQTVISPYVLGIAAVDAINFAPVKLSVEFELKLGSEATYVGRLAAVAWLKLLLNPDASPHAETSAPASVTLRSARNHRNMF